MEGDGKGRGRGTATVVGGVYRGEKRNGAGVEWRGSEREEKAAGVRALCDNPLSVLHFPASLTFDIHRRQRRHNNYRTTAPPHHRTTTRRLMRRARPTRRTRDKQRDPPKPQTPLSTNKTPRPALDASCVQARKPSANTRCAASRWRGGVSAWMSAHRAAQSPSCGRGQEGNPA